MGVLAEELWNTFNLFEEFVRCKESLSEFVVVWAIRRRKAESAGYVYPCGILVMKLLHSSRLSNDKVLSILSEIDLDNMDSICNLDRTIDMLKQIRVDDEVPLINNHPVNTERSNAKKMEKFDPLCLSPSGHNEVEDDTLWQIGPPLGLYDPTRSIVRDDIGIGEEPSTTARPEEEHPIDQSAAKESDLVLPAVELKIECCEDSPDYYQAATDNNDPKLDRSELFACPQPACDFVATNFVALKKHKRKVHAEVGYPCEQCNYTATHLSQLKVHINSKHKGIRYLCDQCNHASTTMFDLKRHKRSKHLGVKYPCDLCSHVSAQLGSLIEHKKAKHEGVRYPCDQCDYAATHRSNLVKHKKSKHEGVKYLCDQCTYVATQLPKLKAHKQNKHEGVVYPCEECDYKATTTYSLKEHRRRVHEGVRFPCDQCEYVANHVSHLKEHIRNLHEGVRYPCTQCDYTASRLPMLKQHVKSKHQGIRHKCDECNYSATLISNLNHHIKVQHRGLRYNCNQCEYSSTRQDKTKKHLHQKHGVHLNTINEIVHLTRPNQCHLATQPQQQDSSGYPTQQPQLPPHHQHSQQLVLPTAISRSHTSRHYLNTVQCETNPSSAHALPRNPTSRTDSRVPVGQHQPVGSGVTGGHHLTTIIANTDLSSIQNL